MSQINRLRTTDTWESKTQIREYERKYEEEREKERKLKQEE